jgi:predicted small metal-binding protein
VHDARIPLQGRWNAGLQLVAKGKDDDEVMRKATEHAKRDHNMQTVPPDLERKARGAIRESTEHSKR